MIGNDIVDLQLASKSHRWRSKRLWDRVFTPAEQEHFLSSRETQLQIWRLWSMKESAYKIFVQKYAQTFNSPLKISCHIHSESLGAVTIQGNTFTSISNFHDDAIHSIAYSGENIDQISAMYKTRSTTLKEIRRACYGKLITSLATYRNNDIDNLKIKKDQLGIPHMYVNEVKQNVSITLSHHGSYYAFAHVEMGMTNY